MDYKGTIYIGLPDKVNPYSKYFRILRIVLKGKFSLINKIKKRDISIFRKSKKEYWEQTKQNFIEKYSPENYENFLSHFIKPDD